MSYALPLAAKIEDFAASGPLVRFQATGFVAKVLQEVDSGLPKQFPRQATELTARVRQAVSDYAASHGFPVIAVSVSQGLPSVELDQLIRFNRQNTAPIVIDPALHHALDKTYADVTGVEAEQNKLVRINTQKGDVLLSIYGLSSFDGRAQLEHILKRLQYMKAVMVMLSTTDMLGTSHVLGNHMARQSALVQQVQRLGRQIDTLSKKIGDSLQKNETVSPKQINQSLQNIVKQIGKMQGSAPPQMQPLVQIMMAQVKDLPRQLPILQNNKPIVLHAKTQNVFVAKPELRPAAPRQKALPKTALRLAASNDKPTPGAEVRRVFSVVKSNRNIVAKIADRIGTKASKAVSSVRALPIKRQTITAQLKTASLASQQTIQTQASKTIIDARNRFRLAPAKVSQTLAKIDGVSSAVHTATIIPIIRNEKAQTTIPQPKANRAEIKPPIIPVPILAEKSAVQAETKTIPLFASGKNILPFAPHVERQASAFSTALTERAAHLPFLETIQKPSGVAAISDNALPKSERHEAPLLVKADEKPATPPAQGRVQENTAKSEADAKAAPIAQAPDPDLVKKDDVVKQFKAEAEHICGPNCPIHGSKPQAAVDIVRQGSLDDFLKTPKEELTKAPELKQPEPERSIKEQFRTEADHVCGPNCPIHGSKPQAAADQTRQASLDDFLGAPKEEAAKAPEHKQPEPDNPIKQEFRIEAEHICGPNCPIHGSKPQADVDASRQGSLDDFLTAEQKADTKSQEEKSVLPDAADLKDTEAKFVVGMEHVCGPNCPIHGIGTRAADNDRQTGLGDFLGMPDQKPVPIIQIKTQAAKQERVPQTDKSTLPPSPKPNTLGALHA